MVELRGNDPRAWLVDGQGLIERDAGGQVVAVNLDIKNPNAKAAEDHRTASEILSVALKKEEEVLGLLHDLQALIGEHETA